MNKLFAQTAVTLAVVVLMPVASFAAPLHGLDKAEVRAHNQSVVQEVNELKAQRNPLLDSIRQIKRENTSLRAEYKAGNLDRAAYRAAHAENIAEIKDLRQQVNPILSEIKSLNSLRVRGRDTNLIATGKIAQFVQLLAAEIESQLTPQFNLANQTNQITSALTRSVNTVAPVNVKASNPLVNAAPRLAQSFSANNQTIALGANQPTTLSMIASGERVADKQVTLNVEKDIQVSVSVSANIAQDVLSGDMDALARDLYANVVNVNAQKVANTVRFEGNTIIFSHS